MRSLLLLLALVSMVPLRAAPAKYLADSHTDVLTLLAPPPVKGSQEDAVDFQTVLKVYATATPAETALATDEHVLTIFHYAPAIGPWFQKGKFPKTEALFAEVEAETKAVTSAGKAHWQRLRPYQVDPVAIPHAVEHEKLTDYSYPSGHSTRGTIYALLLAELFPAQREAILAKGREVGWLRVKGGVHYPTDIYAGRVLGQALARDFLANPAFQADLAAAKAELELKR